MQKSIHLLGATGSIGEQTLDVIRNHPDQFKLTTFSFHQNWRKALQIIQEFKPLYVSCTSEQLCREFQMIIPNVKFSHGKESLIEAATYDSTGPVVVVSALVGSIGLIPTVEAIKKGYTIALANKETLVTAGHLVMDLANKHNVSILPVDSEHSAIFQALQSGEKDEIKRLILTASGGALRDLNRHQLEHVTLQEVLDHPNWLMGKKITVDSATMMNKGLEVIEAHWLFDVPYDKIETIIHRESIIHSMVEFIDNSSIAQLGIPDMRVPIQYALTFPKRSRLHFGHTLDLTKLQSLSFEEMDFERFVMLKYAYDAGTTGGSMPTVLNASNEAAVKLFLEGKISFLEIEEIVYNALKKHKLIKKPDLETIIQLDAQIKTNILANR